MVGSCPNIILLSSQHGKPLHAPEGRTSRPAAVISEYISSNYALIGPLRAGLRIRGSCPRDQPVPSPGLRGPQGLCMARLEERPGYLRPAALSR
eukprot:338321-Pyramimonas_sp.AAC.1